MCLDLSTYEDFNTLDFNAQLPTCFLELDSGVVGTISLSDEFFAWTSKSCFVFLVVLILFSDL